MPESTVRQPPFKSVMEWLYFLYPISLAANKNANDIVAATLFLGACLFLAIEWRACLPALRAARRGWLLALTMPLVLVVIQRMALTPPLDLRDFDDYSRFFLCIPVYLAALVVRPGIKKLLWGCVLFTLYSVPLMIYHMVILGAERGVPPNGFLPIIAHTSFAIIFALAALPLAAQGRGLLIKKILPLATLCAAIAMPLLTQTRSGLLLLLALGLLVWLLQPRRDLRLLLLAAGVAVALTALVGTSSLLWSRSDRTIAEISEYATTPHTPLTSATIRIELWKLAGKIALSHPLIGIGNHRFHDGLAAYKAQGQTPPDLEIFSHPHNDFLKMASEGGLLGVLAFGLLIVVPLTAGGRAYRRTDGVTHPGLLVIVFASGVLLAGMVDVVLIWRPTIMFYGMAMSLLLVRLDDFSNREVA